MIPVGTTSESRTIDQKAVEQGIPSLLLMENAAFSLFIEAEKLIKSFKPNKIIAFAGKGGNGGDALALLRILLDRGYDIPTYYVPLFDEKDLQGDTKLNFTMLPKSVKKADAVDFIGKILFIDGMIGTGLSKDLSPKFQQYLRTINSYPYKKVLAIDVPTGINSDSGYAMPEAVHADVTVSMGILKQGLFLNNGITHSGKVFLGNISAPKELTFDIKTAALQERDFSLSAIPLDSYKNKNGHTLFIGGDVKMVGASIIAAQSFLAAGGGLATLALKKKHLPFIAGKHPGLMLTDIDELHARQHDFSAVVIGPGLTELEKEVEHFLISYSGVIVADAGMINHLAHDEILFKTFLSKKVIFTPHPGELQRFSSIKFKKKDEFQDIVSTFPLSETQVLYAKNCASFIRSVEKTRILPPGAKALSFGGTGDSLAGIIAACTHKSETLQKAACNAGLIHRKAGLILEEKATVEFHSIEALISHIPTAINYLREAHEDY